MSEERKTQRAILLALLMRNLGIWVPLPEILALGIAQYSARIHETRKLGFQIESKTQRIGGKRHSWFRLVSAQSSEVSPCVRVCAHTDQGPVPKSIESPSSSISFDGQGFIPARLCADINPKKLATADSQSTETGLLFELPEHTYEYPD